MSAIPLQIWHHVRGHPLEDATRNVTGLAFFQARDALTEVAASWADPVVLSEHLQTAKDTVTEMLPTVIRDALPQEDEVDMVVVLAYLFGTIALWGIVKPLLDALLQPRPKTMPPRGPTRAQMTTAAAHDHLEAWVLDQFRAEQNASIDRCCGVLEVVPSSAGSWWSTPEYLVRDPLTAHAILKSPQNASNMESLVPAMQQVVDAWMTSSLKPESGIDLPAELALVAAQVLTVAAFGYDLSRTEAQQVVRATSTDRRDFATKLLLEYRTNTLESDKKEGLWIHQLDQNSEYESDEERITAIVQFWTGEWDKVTHTLSKVVQELTTQPDLQTSVRQSLDSPLLSQVIQETWRLHPTGSPTVVLKEDVPVLGSSYVIPAGSTCHIHLYAMHRHGEVHVNPDSFEPQRWQGEQAATRLSSHMIPLSALSQTTVQIILTSLLETYEMSRHDPEWTLTAAPATTSRALNTAPVVATKVKDDDTPFNIMEPLLNLLMAKDEQF
eukprot:CAMPEP_0172441774 /NCGR_PEP_ID=MMETSP1065-20121228/2276_1 /TAXON_ID=265537 /ORGANISM="Amphiprora paludosa, Strain CCMP125" /LENGTH=496 /DNA_ID=CAMNT_0013191301 /DNA_START=139 /DNA_END=1629 /DNA_ORIENTATION=-